MSHYKSNLKDIEFNLFEVLKVEKTYEKEPFAQVDKEAAKDILKEVERLASKEIAASFTDADRNPPRLVRGEDTKVEMPKSFLKSYQAYTDAGWDRLGLPESLGGINAPPSLRWAAAEMFLGANPAVYMYGCGAAFALFLYENGTEMQKEFAKLAVERQWSATMVLTEPDAGSDVGNMRMQARQQEDGSWHLEGVKRFITGGEWDWPENIFHLVLARPVGVENAGGAGTKGLSLFLVSKYHFDLEKKTLGQKNGVEATNLEDKMGLKASTTCELTFGEKKPAVGYLVGDTHQGIYQMFQIIEHARMLVGTKAISTLSSGYLNSLEYAKTRVQGSDLKNLTDKNAKKVLIIEHPDVRVMLMRQKAFAEGLRALVLYTAHVQDQVEQEELTVKNQAENADKESSKEGSKENSKESILTLAELKGLNDFLLPIVKGYGSEKAYELLSTSLQVFGGSGFTKDYPIEQYIRDSKIDTLYEGTTSIQGLDFFFRKIVRNNGEALKLLLKEIKNFTDKREVLSEEKEKLAFYALEVEKAVESMVATLMKTVEKEDEIYKVGLNATRLLMMFGDLVVGWLLLRQSGVAKEKLGSSEIESGENSALHEKDKNFYLGKVEAGSWFLQSVLVELPVKRKVIEETTLSLMNLPQEAF